MQVARLCRTLFQALQSEHQLGPKHELLLHVAALLHEIGLYVGISSHHKHSMYLILNSELFGSASGTCGWWRLSRGIIAGFPEADASALQHARPREPGHRGEALRDAPRRRQR